MQYNYQCISSIHFNRAYCCLEGPVCKEGSNRLGACRKRRHCFMDSLFVPLDCPKPPDGAVRTPRHTTNLFGQAGRLSYVGRATLALRARPVAQLRCSVIFSAIVLASGTVWLDRKSTRLNSSHLGIS